jgi:hypothetical protein
MSLKGKIIFIGPQEIAGFLSRTALALAEGGAEVIAFKQLHSEYQPPTQKHCRIQWLFASTVESISKSNRVLRQGMQFLIKIYVLLLVSVKADACLFIGGKGFFNYPFDYYLLRLLGKRVVHMYVGTASRPRYLSSYSLGLLFEKPVKKNKSIKKLIRRVKRQRSRVAAFSSAASIVIENPLCGHFQTRPFVNVFKLGIPIKISSNGQPPHNCPALDGRKIRILHCPSKPEIKGTERILSILSNDVLERLNAELIVLTGVPRIRVLEEIKKCDFVIDQLYSDSPLAGFAAESASLNKVPIVGGYGWEELKKSLKNDEIPPALLCHPSQLLQSVEQLCQSPSKREELASKLNTFLLEGEWSSRAFVNKLGRILTGDIPEDWMIDPDSINYKCGVGLTEEQARQLSLELVESGGTDALQLGVNPHLEKKFTDWINLPSETID